MQSSSLVRRAIGILTSNFVHTKNTHTPFRCLSTSTVKLGDKVPINYIKDAKEPVIKEDKDYPGWVFQLHARLPSKNGLMSKLESDGIESLSIDDSKRLKRLITLKTIKDSNLSNGKSTGV